MVREGLISLERQDLIKQKGSADKSLGSVGNSDHTPMMHHYVREAPVAGSSLRSLGAFGNVFGIESFMDELAAAADADPVEFRLRHLKDPRGRAVIEAAVQKSRWADWQP